MDYGEFCPDQVRYLRTIDICHDHFGFYLAWGSAVWLPTMYTLQSQYLSRYPVQLSTPVAALIFTIGVSGYALFRSVNFQKDIVRRTNGECTIWGKKAKVMRCNFKTADGKDHQTLLLLSGKSISLFPGPIQESIPASKSGEHHVLSFMRTRVPEMSHHF